MQTQRATGSLTWSVSSAASNGTAMEYRFFGSKHCQCRLLFITNLDANFNGSDREYYFINRVSILNGSDHNTDLRTLNDAGVSSAAVMERR